MDVGEMLRELGLGQYEAAFRENEIDDAVLPKLTVDDLKDLGVSVVGHRRRILSAIEALNTPSATHDAPVTLPSLSAHVDAAERRQLTVMFCDLVGSTALSSRLDPEEMRQVIRTYQDAVSGIIVRYDGFVAKFMGDGVLAYFGFPRAHEDDAERAVHAGLELSEVVAGLETRAREKLVVRIGIATGLVVVGDIVGQGPAQEQAVVGDTPNLAARLQGLAHPGQVVVSAVTRRLIGDRFRLENLGRHAVKGLVEPVEAFAALGVWHSESRFEAAHAKRLAGFVGRETESANLLERQRRAWGGHGQIVLISGEAGIGKSRLSEWLGEQVAETPHVRLRYQCSPFHRDSALYPFVQQFERAANISPQEPSESKLDKLEKVLGLATARMLEIAPVIASLLSIPLGDRYPVLTLSPAQQRRQTLAALLDQMEGLARQQPVLMLLEDAHWADATSLELLDLAVERVRRLPVLLVITFRPEFEAAWKGLPDVTEIALQRLDRAEAETLVERVTGGRKLPDQVLAQIVAKTDGVPLFVEELTKNVIESGLLIEDGDCYRLNGPLPPLAIPSTLQDSLMARIDRLATVKEIAQIGAAIGREFSYPLLQAVVGLEETALRSALAQLEESELVFRKGTPPHARYSFKHALVQDTAYESLLKSRRQILHRQIAEALRDKFPVIAEAEPELLAHHFSQAGLAAQAIEYWGKAGDFALRRSAFKEAIAHLGKAIEMTDAAVSTSAERPDDRLKLHISYGNALIAASGYGAPETTAAFVRAREIVGDDTQAPERFSIAYGVWVGSYMRCELAVMQEVAAAFVGDVESRPEVPESSVAFRINGVTKWLAGDFSGAKIDYEKALAIFNPVRDGDLAFRFGQDPGVGGLAYQSLTLWPLGEIERAVQSMGGALARAAGLTHIGTIAYARMHAAMFELMRGDYAKAAPHANALAELAREHDLKMWRAFGVFLDGWNAWRESACTRGRTEMRDGLALIRDQKVVIFDGLLRCALASADAQVGDFVSALTCLEEAVAISERTGACWYDAEVHRSRGEILLKQNLSERDNAEEAFLTAISIAQNRKARGFELRGSLSLARFYRSTGRDADAHAALEPILMGFEATPGFPDFAEALELRGAIEAQ